MYVFWDPMSTDSSPDRARFLAPADADQTSFEASGLGEPTAI